MLKLHAVLSKLFQVTLASAIIWGCAREDEARDEQSDNPDVDTGRETAPRVELAAEGGCTFSHVLSMSDAIPTVGTVTWAVTPKMTTDARIEFGLDADYGFSAPGRFQGSKYTTILLGMKPETTYHYRLVATVVDTACISDDYTIKTGPLPAGIPMPTVVTPKPTEVEPGFTVSTFFSTGNRAFILDNDGDYVWWYAPKGDISDWVRARMSYDGEHIFIANGNVPSMGRGTLVRVKMDGTDERTYDVPNRHHDVLILPDETIVTMEYEDSGRGTCDRIMEMDPETGNAVEVFKVRDHFSQLAEDSEWCHSNAINYVPSEDAYYLSVLNQDMIIKWKRSSGELLWAFGGSVSDFKEASWNAQHQFQVLPDGILFFNNQLSVFDIPSGGGVETDPAAGGFFRGAPSHVLEWSVSEPSKSASLVWDYSSGSISSYSMGDAKRLPNGNTLITFSTQGIIQEVNSQKSLVREIKWSGPSLGYANRVPSLYSIPPEYDFYPHR